MIGLFATLLLAASYARGTRPKIHVYDEEGEQAARNGVVVPKRGLGGSNGEHKMVCAALRAMPVRPTQTEKNAAKRLRKARRK